MPQFILDHGSIEGATVFNGLDEFTQGYITAMFWTEQDELEDGTMAELAPEALRDILADCEAFQTLNREDLEAYQEAGRSLEYAGHDFWLTRNGHGVGFWDRWLAKDLGERLTRAAETYGEVYAYRGSDGWIYHG